MDDSDIPDDVFSPSEELPWEPPKWFWQKRITASTMREVFRWTTIDGKTYLLKDLSDQHLANIVPYIERVKMVGVSKEEVKRLKEIRGLMISEQKYRKKHEIIVAPYGPKISFIRKEVKL